MSAYGGSPDRRATPMSSSYKGSVMSRQGRSPGFMAPKGGDKNGKNSEKKKQATQ